MRRLLMVLVLVLVLAVLTFTAVVANLTNNGVLALAVLVLAFATGKEFGTNY